jgi:hypothetical protein
VEQRERGVRGPDQAVVDGHGHLVVEQRRLERRREMADLRHVDVGLDRGGERRRQRVLQLAVGAQQGFERGLAHGPVRILQMRAVRAFGQRQRLAAGADDVRKHHVRIRQQAEGLFGGRQHLGGARQQGFFGGGKHVRLVAQHLQQRAAAVGQARILHPRADLLLRMRQQFRGDPGALGGDLGIAGADAGLAALRAGLRRVLVVAQVGVGVQALQQAVEHRLGLEQPRHRFGGIELALHRQHRRGRLVEAREVRLPRLDGGIQRRQVPGQRLGHLASDGNGRRSFQGVGSCALQSMKPARASRKDIFGFGFCRRCPMLGP